MFARVNYVHEKHKHIHKNTNHLQNGHPLVSIFLIIKLIYRYILHKKSVSLFLKTCHFQCFETNAIVDFVNIHDRLLITFFFIKFDKQIGHNMIFLRLLLSKKH